MRKRYPSDISRAQFSLIEPILLSARKKTSPRKLDLYDVFCAVLYLLKTGCQWHALPKEHLSQVKNFLVDGGYTGIPFATAIKETLGATVEVAKRSELHQFAVIPKRWVIERSFAWLEKCRRLWKNCERKINTSLHMLVLAFIRLPIKKL